MKKHNKISHNKPVKCSKCCQKFDKSEMLTKKIEDIPIQGSQIPDVSEWSLCKYIFRSQIEYQEYVNANLEEI